MLSYFVRMKIVKGKHLVLIVFVTLFVFNALVLVAHGLLNDNRSTCYGISRGQDFVIAFTDNIFEWQHIDSRQLSISVVAFSDQRTDVTISSKHEVNGQPLQEKLSINAREYQSVTIPDEYILSGTERSLKGLKIIASSDVSVYGLSYQKYTTDGFVSIPVYNLGTEYVVVTPPEDSGTPSLFAVIGTEDSTLVQVSLRTTFRVTFEGQTYYSGDVISFMIDDLEAVQIQGGDLTGTIIQSDKAVSVFSGHVCISIDDSACDTVSEQLVPVQSWGRNHLYTAFDNSDSNIYYVAAYFDNTTVSIPGIENQILNAGDVWEGDLVGSGLASSSSPTLMMQLMIMIEGSIVDTNSFRRALWKRIRFYNTT